MKFALYLTWRLFRVLIVYPAIGIGAMIAFFAGMVFYWFADVWTEFDKEQVK